MRWASAISDQSVLAAAVEEAAARIANALGGDAPTLVLAFVSPQMESMYKDVPREVLRAFPSTTLVGCTGGGVIGAGREIEDRSAVSLIAAHLPGVRSTPFYAEMGDLPREIRALQADANPHFIVLPDPFTFDAGRFLHQLDMMFPNSKKIGGLASGGRTPGANALFLGDTVHRSGAVGVALEGDLVVDTIVAQGCKPIGTPMLITRCQDKVIFELGGKPPLIALQELAKTLSARDRELVTHSLFLGIEMKDQVEYKAGDFLIRNITGADPDCGAIAVGALPQQWQVAQFHLRD